MKDSLARVLGVARMELRQTRRLVRFWIFGLLAALLATVTFLYMAGFHTFFSGYNPTAGIMNPTYMGSALAYWFIGVFAFGLILLAFDVRARDRRERILEVLDSRPISNLELLTGRAIGLVLPIWVFGVVVLVALQGFGLLGRSLNWIVGGAMTTQSLFVVPVLQMLPALLFVVAFVFLVALLVPNRLLVAVISLASLGALFWFGFRTPTVTAPAYDLFGGYAFYPSEVASSIALENGILQRLGVLVGAIGLLVLASAVHPRRDGGSKGRRLAIGGLLVAACLAVSVFFLVDGRATIRGAESLSAAHLALADEAVADLRKVEATVRIDPGGSLEVEAALDLGVPEDRALERLVFALNPGLEVQSFADASGQSLATEQRDGLLLVALPSPLPAGGSASYRVTLAGRPAEDFGYFDGSIDPNTLPAFNNTLVTLGFLQGLNHSDYVALMPGQAWLPMPGPVLGQLMGDDRPTDFFGLDLTVEVPGGWLPATTGRRESLGSDGGRDRYRFAPAAPVPSVALLAAPFERLAAEAGGVELELLISPEHRGNLEILAEAKDELVAWIGERLGEAEEVGLAYPYETLRLVEVPHSLRIYGGGWRHESVLGHPGTLLVRENSLPTARFAFRFRNPKKFEDAEGGVARAKRDAVLRFFENDFYGGNLFQLATPSFFRTLTAPRGDGATALGYALERLAQRLLTDRDGFFSAHIFADRRASNAAFGTLFGSPDSWQGQLIADDVRQDSTDRVAVWDRVLDRPLTALDPESGPRAAFDALVLKGDAFADALLETLGRENAGRLLGILRDRHAGGTFTRDELVVAADSLDVDLRDLLRDWLDSTSLPGFIASDSRLERLPDGADGTARYQLALHLRNPEPVAGMARLQVRTGEDDEKEWQDGPAVRLEAGESRELGLVLSSVPDRLRVRPFLSLNRGAFIVPLPRVSDDEIVDAEPLQGSRPSTWERAAGVAIVVDDLDPGFSVELDEGEGLRLQGSGDEDQDLDQGLPALQAGAAQMPKDWARLTWASAFGHYRRSLAVARRGPDNRRAVFGAEVPRGGRWALDFHIPAPPRAAAFGPPPRPKTYKILVDDGVDVQELSLDARSALEGWNTVAELELQAGSVRVILSNETDGPFVVADAIRWRPVGGLARALEDEAAVAAGGDAE